MSTLGSPTVCYAAAQNRVKALEICLAAEKRMTTHNDGTGGSYNLGTVEMYIQALRDLESEVGRVLASWENFLAAAEEDDEKSEVEEAPVSDL